MGSQGTTGNPKGVVLKHGHLATAAQSNLYGPGIPPDAVLFSYLPLAHIYEASYYKLSASCDANAFL